MDQSSANDARKQSWQSHDSTGSNTPLRPLVNDVSNRITFEELQQDEMGYDADVEIQLPTAYDDDDDDDEDNSDVAPTEEEVNMGDEHRPSSPLEQRMTRLSFSTPAASRPTSLSTQPSLRRKRHKRGFSESFGSDSDQHDVSLIGSRDVRHVKRRLRSSPTSARQSPQPQSLSPDPSSVRGSASIWEPVEQLTDFGGAQANENANDDLMDTR